MDRARLLDGPALALPNGNAFNPAVALEVFDRFSLSDGYSFVLDDDGRADGCHYLNGP